MAVDQFRSHLSSHPRALQKLQGEEGKGKHLVLWFGFLMVNFMSDLVEYGTQILSQTSLYNKTKVISK